MIYFDRDVQQRVVSLLERHLAPGGYLFISHSESLNGIDARPALGRPGRLPAERRMNGWTHSRDRAPRRRSSCRATRAERVVIGIGEFAVTTGPTRRS